eukprot:TRINITY_DN11537_c0_g1_i4.p1 TRINITY_DN11537_c0_g1~~TRINITY_DN11537_c0_g1_i4.p1  ORF type:complete len:125 (+),score=9.55 TRINITY_DN11537_c0_g1_i4:34-408(+)
MMLLVMSMYVSTIKESVSHSLLLACMHDTSRAQPLDLLQNKYVRLTLGVLLLGETVVHCNGPPQSRKDVTCQVTYLAHVHPGGWAPPSVVRAVSQREYPKFLRNLEKHCLKHYQDKPLGIETDV